MFKFETGDTVLFHRGSLLYDAECLKHQQNEYGEPEYYVRCTIRKKEWEGWVAEDKLLVYDPDNLFQQKRMKYAHLRHKRFGNIDWLSETESDEYDSSSADEKSNSIKVNRGMYTPRKYTDNFMIDRGFYDSSEDYDCYSDSNDCSCSSVSSVEHSNGNPNDSSNNPNNGGNNAVNSNNHPDNSGDNSVDPNNGNNNDSGENDDVINSQSSADDHSDEELADGEGGTDSNDDNFFPGDDDDTGTDNDDDTDTDNNDDDDDHGPVNFDDNSDDSGCSEGSSSSDSSCDCDSSSTEPSLFGSSSSSSSDSSGTIDSSNDDSSNGSNNSSSSNDSYSTSNGNSSYESSDNNIHDSVISEESDEPFREEADKNSDKEPVDGEKLVDSDGEETDEDNSEATDDSNNEESDDSNSEETNDSNSEETNDSNSEESDDSNSEESDDSNSEETNDSNNEGSDDSNNEGSDDDAESVECECVDYFPDVSEEDSLSVLSRLDVEMPSTLVKWLVNDWNCVCNGQNLHFLPAKYTIADIIEDYMRRKIYTEDENGSDEDSKSITLDICDGIIKYFNAMLGSKLLYVKERYQYRDVLDEYKGQPLTSVYGGTHLLRLLATLGSMDFRMQIDDTTIKLLHDHIAEMYEYLAARCNALYQYNQYTLIPVSYYRRLIQNQ